MITKGYWLFSSRWTSWAAKLAWVSRRTAITWFNILFCAGRDSD